MNPAHSAPRRCAETRSDMTSTESVALELDTDTHRQITLLSRAWGTTPQGVFHRLLTHFEHTVTAQADARRAQEALATPPSPIPVHAIYANTRIDALFDPVTTAVTITNGPGKGTYKSPSGASAAAISALRPGITPNRTGWSFWRISASGQPLSALRTPARINLSPTTPPALMPAQPPSAVRRLRPPPADGHHRKACALDPRPPPPRSPLLHTYEPADLDDMTIIKGLDAVLADLRDHPISPDSSGLFNAMRHIDLLCHLTSRATGETQYCLFYDHADAADQARAEPLSQAAGHLGRATATTPKPWPPLSPCARAAHSRRCRSDSTRSTSTATSACTLPMPSTRCPTPAAT